MESVQKLTAPAGAQRFAVRLSLQKKKDSAGRQNLAYCKYTLQWLLLPILVS